MSTTLFGQGKREREGKKKKGLFAAACMSLAGLALIHSLFLENGQECCLPPKMQ
jgi:hypothetical protein